MSILVTAHVAHEIEEHVRATTPLECCGALLAPATRTAARVTAVEAIVPLVNSAPSPRHHFLIQAAEVRRAERAADARRLHVVGFYHSHPTSRSAPSARDLASAWPWYVYLILGTDDMRAWRLRGDRRAFDAVPVRIAQPVAAR